MILLKREVGKVFKREAKVYTLQVSMAVEGKTWIGQGGIGWSF